MQWIFLSLECFCMFVWFFALFQISAPWKHHLGKPLGRCCVATVKHHGTWRTLTHWVQLLLSQITDVIQTPINTHTQTRIHNLKTIRKIYMLCFLINLVAFSLFSFMLQYYLMRNLIFQSNPLHCFSNKYLISTLCFMESVAFFFDNF